MQVVQNKYMYCRGGFVEQISLYPLKKQNIKLFDPDICSQFFNLLLPSKLLSQALFCVAFKVNGKMQQHFIHSYEDLEIVLQTKQSGANSYCDCYITPNTFFVPVRQYRYLHRLNYLFIDIDNHNETVDKHTINGLLEHLQEDYFGSKIPMPTIIVGTGRGLQLYFKIKPLSYNNKTIKFWKKIEQGLIDIMSSLDFNGFVTDKKVNDATRLLRLPGSYNINSKTYAEILYQSDTEYTLTEISQGYVFGGTTTGQKYKKYKGNKHTTVVGKGRYRGTTNSSSFNEK